MKNYIILFNYLFMCFIFASFAAFDHNFNSLGIFISVTIPIITLIILVTSKTKNGIPLSRPDLPP